jgi:hypothetical protein
MDLMETYYSVFTKQFGVARPPKEKLKVCFYHDYETFLEVSGAPYGVLAYYRFVQPRELNFYYDRLRPDETTAIMFHEAQHYLSHLLDLKFHRVVYDRHYNRHAFDMWWRHREILRAIGERTAEEIKVAIGSADPTPDENQAEVRGRDLMTGLPKTVVLTPEEIRFAIEDVVSSIVASVIRCLAKAPPELSQDFLVRGMYLVGGGGLLRGLASRIERETKVPVRMSNVPLEAVVLGAGHVIEHYDALKGMFMGVRR